VNEDQVVYRYVVPVDDNTYTHKLSGRIVHVDCRRHDVVEFWALANVEPPVTRYFRVYGTGHPTPRDAVYVGTAVILSETTFSDFGQLVWHLFELPAPREES
jgi:hypothetical protein